MNLVAEDDFEPLVTECPKCHTRFRVVEGQLQSARGRVRCGACLSVFDGVEHLVWEQGEHFSSPEEARSALDELLSELEEESESRRASRKHASPDAGRHDSRSHGFTADRGRAGTAAPVVPLFSGFEEEPLMDAAHLRDPTVEFSAHALDEVSEEVAGEVSDEVSGQFSDEDSGDDSKEASAEVSGEVSGGFATGAAGGTLSPSSTERVDPEAVDAADVVPADIVGDSAAALESGPDAAGANRLTAGPEPVEATQSDVSLAERRPGSLPLVFGEPVRQRPLVSAGIALAAFGMLAQLLWYQFDDWSRTPFWRPVYGQLCGLIGCELPAQRDLNRLRTRNLVVRSHPTEPGALAVNAVIVNEAAFDQPFPDLELRFTSMSGQLVARRTFLPAEYLAGEASDLRLMPARTPVQIQLDIEDPGPDAVNYTMKIR